MSKSENILLNCFLTKFKILWTNIFDILAKKFERGSPSIIQIYRYVSHLNLSHLTNVNLA